MMNLSELAELSQKISRLYETEGPIFAQFQKKSGLHCLPECGACCTHPEISASIAEMLPMAFLLFHRGEAEISTQKLDHLELGSTCIFYKATSEDQTKGFCIEYQHRPVVCRSFGACAVKSKSGEKILSLCHHIKKTTKVNLEALSLSEAPLIENFASTVRSVDVDSKLYPINLALKMALEKVLMAANYENEY